jgi:hypothetical protein
MSNHAKVEMGTAEKELHTPSRLLDQKGRLVQVGWSRQPLLEPNLEDADFYPIHAFQRFRMKSWDYYGVTTPGGYFSATLAHLGYAGLVFVYSVDFAAREYHEETVLVPLGRGITLSRGSIEGESSFDNGSVKLLFRVQPEERHLSVTWPDFGGGDLAAEMTLYELPDQESMNIAIPIGEKRFYYNRKMNCLPADGWVQRDGRQEEVLPDESLGNMDWGRGVWPYRSFWVWASASGFLDDGRTVGLNLGYGFGDTSAATENALILGGRIHKLDKVNFTYDPTNFMLAWRMVSDDGRLDLHFTPFLERVAKSNLLVINSEVHQMFGRYAGTVVSDDGETVQLNDMTGFAEEHRARW